MEKEKYLLKLKEQFKSATGTTTIDINSLEFIKEFNDWLFRRRVSGDEILRTLDKLEIETDKAECAEVGKGKYDSIVYPYDTTIITPYYQSFNTLRPSNGIIINDELDVTGGVPILTNINTLRVINPTEITTYMTHNPYNNEDINKWIQLHNNPDNAIIFSVYGNIYDKDRDSKIKMLKDLKSKLIDTDTIIEEEILGKDKYWNILATDIYAKQRKRKM